MQVVNDIVGWRVFLMDEYSKLHTNDEEQKQFLLVVKEHLQRYPDQVIKTIIFTCLEYTVKILISWLNIFKII